MSICTYTYSHIHIYKIYFAEHEKQDICIYIYLWHDNDYFMSKVKHVTTNKEESFSRKCLASIIANTVNIMKMCYSRITSTISKDTTAVQLM